MWRLESSWRVAPAEETLARATPLMPLLGISRVTDITRMDRLGLPVFASVRPRGKVLRVHAGKGLQAMQARVGALMEAVEFAVADPERQTWQPRSLSVAELMRDWGGGLRLSDFAPRLGQDLSLQRRLVTVDCEELRSGRCVALPAELVFFPFAPPDEAPLFGASTNGLASGNSLEEATLHALFEVLERDALSLNKAVDQSQWVVHRSLPEPWRSLAGAWRRMGIALAVRSLPNVCGLACFEAYLHEPSGSQVDLAGGSGLHADAGIALARAICEAAQSRLSHIHGGRDDVTRFYDGREQHQAQAASLARIFDRRRRVRFDALASRLASEGLQPPVRSLRPVLERLLRRMSDRGLDAVYRHRLALPGASGLHVVRLVVARCEDIEHQPQRFGPRLLTLLMRRG